MVMKFCEIGVYHHDCWFTDAISMFPELQVKETSGRVCTENSEKRTNRGLYKIFSDNQDQVNNFIKQVNSNNQVLGIKQIDGSLIQVTWKALKTSHDAILNSGCIISSSCYARDGYETYSLFAEQPKTIKRLLSELEELGDVKIFSMKNTFSKNMDKFGLTDKQKQAIAAAISIGYYSWPKKVNLEELAKRIGMKRRTLQENLRKAESKILPMLLDELTNQ